MGGCHSNCKEWLNAEHNLYSIPLNTPVDAKVLVKQHEEDKWEKGYFAGFAEGDYCPYETFEKGTTSWTSGGFCSRWQYCKLASEEEKGAEE